MKTYFPDTNFFFECRKASDLPWHEITAPATAPGPDIRLIVPPTVINEIERHKAKGNSRTAKRARDASALLRQALTSQDHEVELRSENPRVVLALPPVVKIEFKDLPGLDETRADHRIAAEYAKVREHVSDLIALSDDTLLVLALRSLGFDPVLVPESWKLGPEKDERDDQIDRLREEVRSLKANHPDMSFALRGPDGEEARKIEVSISILAPDDSELDAAVEDIASACPIEDDFEKRPSASNTVAGGLMSLGRTWIAPRDEEIEAYRTEKYPRWLKSVRDALPKLIARHNSIARRVPFSVVMRNDGFVNAADVRLTISSYDGVLLLPSTREEDEKEGNGALTLPLPPSPPRGKYVSMMTGFGSPDILVPRRFESLLGLQPRERNPNGFYYLDGRPHELVHELILTCEAFPHQGDERELEFQLWVPDQPGSKPRIRVKLEASNLRKPIESFVKIGIKAGTGDFPAFAAELRRGLGPAER
jgi:hypothetical protein